MKHLLSLILSLFFILNAQFSSGVDYSVKEVTVPDRVSAGFLFETGKTEWSLNYGTDQKFSAVSEMTGFGYEAGGETRFKNIKADYGILHIFREMKNSASNDSAGGVSNLYPDNITFQDVRMDAEILFRDRYGLSVRFAYISDGDRCASSAGVGLRYAATNEAGRRTEFYFSKNFIIEEKFSGTVFMTEPEPDWRTGIKYSAPGKTSEFSVSAEYSCFEGDELKDDQKGFIRAELSYGLTFEKAGSAVSAGAGTCLASDFTLPKIRLPFFYYSLTYKNTLVKDRLDLLIGWDYNAYESDIRYIPGFSGIMPAGTGAEAVNEIYGVNRLSVRLDIKY